MKRNPFVAGILSLVIPVMGQIYVRKSERGAAILLGVVVAVNPNAL